MKKVKKALSPKDSQKLFEILRARFERNMSRHKGFDWAKVEARLDAKPEKLWSLQQMEETGGEPDVVDFDKKTGEFIFYDCSLETPKGRRNLCYDREALDARKEHKPADSAVDVAEAMGIQILTEEQYREFQTLEKFDAKSSSWVITPPAIRKLGGAIYGDRRYDHVFIGHNGASSYFGDRGFRGALKV